MDPVTQFLLREATTADIPALRTLIELSVRGLQKDDYSAAEIEGALGHALGLDTQLIEDRTYFVAEPVGDTGLIIGCGGWSNRRTLFGSDHGPNRENNFLDPETDAAKIRAIFVHPQWARKGVGSLILQHCEEAAQRAGFRTLEMGSTLTGVRLYTRKGYVPRDNVAVPLPNGETLQVVYMVKVLLKNLLYVSDHLTCSGQPDESQLPKLAAEGFKVVINLGLSDGKYALPDEAASMAALGLAYYHIPVLFDSPQLSELISFIEIMQQQHAKKTLVHCAVNYRASAFTGLYLYATSQLNKDELHSFIAQIWNPNPVWQKFIEEACIFMR